MAVWFLRGLGRGVVTTRYPKRADPSAVTLPTPPSFDPSRLTIALADALEAACPSGALHRDGATLVLDLGRCTTCGQCTHVAPDAVRPSGAFELATGDRGHLIKRIPITGAST